MSWEPAAVEALNVWVPGAGDAALAGARLAERAIEYAQEQQR